MMIILISEPCTSFTHPEAKAIIKAINYEFENGLFAVRENDIHPKRCMVATSFYPYVSHITSLYFTRAIGEVYCYNEGILYRLFNFTSTRCYSYKGWREEDEIP